jgi:hypothetical protein
MPYLQNANNTNLHNPTLNDVTGNQYNLNTTNIYSTEDRALAILKPVERGRYSVPGCMDGTRESIFKKIDAWLDDFGTPDSTVVPAILLTMDLI